MVAEFRVLDRTGDGLKLTWDVDDSRQVEAARQTFDDYRRRGYDLFSLDEDDTRGERLTQFNPGAAGILAVPRMRGG